MQKKQSFTFSTLLFCSLLLCLSPAGQANAAVRNLLLFSGKTPMLSAEQEDAPSAFPCVHREILCSSYPSLPSQERSALCRTIPSAAGQQICFLVQRKDAQSGQSPSAPSF